MSESVGISMQCGMMGKGALGTEYSKVRGDLSVVCIDTSLYIKFWLFLLLTWNCFLYLPLLVDNENYHK